METPEDRDDPAQGLVKVTLVAQCLPTVCCVPDSVTELEVELLPKRPETPGGETDNKAVSSSMLG